LVFDLGGTLVSHQSGTAKYDQLKRQTLKSIYDRWHETARLAVDFNSFANTYDATSHRLLLQAIHHNEPMSETDTLRTVAREHGLSIDNDECLTSAFLISRTQSSLSVLYDEVAATLAQLNKQGIPMGLISNTPWLKEAHDEELKRHSLTQYFHFRLYSSAERQWKPHQPIFDRAVGMLGLPAIEIAYVGDRVVDDVQGAQNAGMAGILIDRSKSFIRKECDIAPDWIFSDLRPLTTLPFANI
jgi:FMN phosphatase YigB (HAD superfamily)